MVQPEVFAEGHSRIRLMGLRLDPHRLIYSTLIMMVALAVFDEDSKPFTGSTVGDVFVVVLMPLAALSLAHGFSDAIDIQIRTRHRLTRADRRHIAGTSVQYLLVGLPVLLLAVIFSIVGIDVEVATNIGEALGQISLLFWGAFAARSAGLGRWAQVRFALVYSFLGSLIIVVEVLVAH